MSDDIKEIADNANMIVDGYAFTEYDAGCRVIDLNDAQSAMVIDKQEMEKEKY